MRAITFDGTATRVIHAGEKAWFVARDAMGVAGYSPKCDVTGVFERVPPAEKGFGRIEPNNKRMLLVSLAGLRHFLENTEKKWPHVCVSSVYLDLAKDHDGIAAGGTTGSVEPFYSAEAPGDGQPAPAHEELELRAKDAVAESHSHVTKEMFLRLLNARDAAGKPRKEEVPEPEPLGTWVFEGHPIRVEWTAGEVWFHIGNVCAALGCPSLVKSPHDTTSVAAPAISSDFVRGDFVSRSGMLRMLAESKYPLAARLAAGMLALTPPVEKTEADTLGIPRAVSFEGRQIRVAVVGGTPWLYAEDVCESLGLSSVFTAMDTWLAHVGDKDKMVAADLRGRPTLLNLTGAAAIALGNNHTIGAARCGRFTDWLNRNPLTDSAASRACVAPWVLCTPEPGDALCWQQPVGSAGDTLPPNVFRDGCRFLNTADTSIYTLRRGEWCGARPEEDWAVFAEDTDTFYVFRSGAWQGPLKAVASSSKDVKDAKDDDVMATLMSDTLRNDLKRRLREYITSFQHMPAGIYNAMLESVNEAEEDLEAMGADLSVKDWLAAESVARKISRDMGKLADDALALHRREKVYDNLKTALESMESLEPVGEPESKGG